jgi:hypothetical protein
MDITEQIHRYECERCGVNHSCATSAEGQRLCETCGVTGQKRGELDISWDDDASQLAEMTPAVCGWCDEEVMFVDSDEAWQLQGKTAPGWDTRPFTCLSAPDHKHDPTHVAEASPSASLARCAHCKLTGPAYLFEPFNGMNSAGNLACKSAVTCQIRQGGDSAAYVLDTLLRAVRRELPQATTAELANLLYDLQGYHEDVGAELNSRPDHAEAFSAVIRDREARKAGQS